MWVWIKQSALNRKILIISMVRFLFGVFSKGIVISDRIINLYKKLNILKMRLSLEIQVTTIIIYQSSTVRKLCVEFDSATNMSFHISAICKTVNFHLWNLSHIRMYIDETTCHQAIRALVNSRLDLCQFTFPGLIHQRTSSPSTATKQSC